MYTNDKRLSLKLLSNERDKVKCKGHPRKSWLAQVDCLKKELDLQDEVLDMKLIKKVLIFIRTYLLLLKPYLMAAFSLKQHFV